MRAHRYVKSSRSGASRCGKSSRRRFSRKSRHFVAIWSNSSDTSACQMAGHATVACIINAATGLMSFASGPSANSQRLKWDTAATRRRIEHYKAISSLIRKPGPLLTVGRIAESAIIAVRVVHPYSGPPRNIDLSLGLDRIPMNSKHMEELFSIRIRREQGSQNGGPRRHQRSPRPPDMKIVGGRQRGHRSPFTHALFAKSRDRQPALDQSDIRHCLVSLHSLKGGRRCRTSRRSTVRVHRRTGAIERDCCPAQAAEHVFRSREVSFRRPCFRGLISPCRDKPASVIHAVGVDAKIR